MRAFASIACVALAYGQVLHVDDWVHYVEKPHETEKSCNDVLVEKWKAVGEPPHFRTLNPPAMQKITLPKDRQYPAKDGAFWLSTEATYVVSTGAVTMAFENGTEVDLVKGDLFYSPAGLLHGPIKNKLDGESVIMALADLTPQLGEIPAIIPSATDPAGAVETVQYAFQPREWGPAPPIGLPECITLATYNTPNGQFGALSAKLTANCELPVHYHPTGVFYFFVDGITTVTGDTPEPRAFPTGTARWARPGWTYGPEVSGDEEVVFLVLGLPPDVHDHAETPELVVRDIEPEPVQVAYVNTQYSGYKGKETSALQHKVRRHLRASMAEQDESAFLQQPLQHEAQMDEL